MLYDHGRSADEQAVPQQVARNVTEAIKDVPSAQAIAITGGRSQAGVTGEAPGSGRGGNTDAWMVGFTPEVSTAVWVGTDASEPIKNAQGKPMFGRMLPGSMWQAFMNAALRGAAPGGCSPFVPLGTPP